MLFLIFSLIFSITTSADVIESLIKPVFAPINTPLRITRTHTNPDGEEIFKEYIYKRGNKIRIDSKFGDSTITTFVYDGKTTFIKGIRPTKIGSLEMVFYGSTCGYLSAMEKISPSTEGGAALLATGRQGNKLYLDYNTYLPKKYELQDRVVVFKEYKEIDGFGKIPFLIVKSFKNKVVEITRITDVSKLASIHSNFFSIPKQEGEPFD